MKVHKFHTRLKDLFMKPMQIIIIGAGNRGNTYASYSDLFPEDMKVVAVAEPNPEKRKHFSEKYHLNPSQNYETWEEALKDKPFADGVIITTQDQFHVDPAVAALDAGYHVLMEKPMATTEKDCRLLTEKAIISRKIFGLCHVLRYTSHYQKMKNIIESGAIGSLITIEHIEPVNYWHMAHAYVRGNWRRKDESAPMILAKSCHDMDLLLWFADSPCKFISSFGSLSHFKKENAPEGSTERCIDHCPVETECPYSALKLYLNMEVTGWPVNVITDDLSREGREKALHSGPYGRCVYRCDNDVVDHQVVSMEFENKMTASFTMSAFTDGQRRTRIMGTEGEILGNFQTITLTRFNNIKPEIVWEHESNDAYGHGGGDYGLIKQFIQAVRADDPSLFESSIEASLESHLMAFAAEESRLKNQVVMLL